MAPSTRLTKRKATEAAVLVVAKRAKRGGSDSASESDDSGVGGEIADVINADVGGVNQPQPVPPEQQDRDASADLIRQLTKQVEELTRENAELRRALATVAASSQDPEIRSGEDDGPLSEDAAELHPTHALGTGAVSSEDLGHGGEDAAVQLLVEDGAQLGAVAGRGSEDCKAEPKVAELEVAETQVAEPEVTETKMAEAMVVELKAAEPTVVKPLAAVIAVLAQPQPRKEVKFAFSALEKADSFVRSLHRCDRIDHLDLTELPNPATLLYPARKKQALKLLHNVLNPLASTVTENVKGLDLGDASWAAEPFYVRLLRKVLLRFKPNLQHLRVSIRALVERCIADRPKRTGRPDYEDVDVLGVVASMPKLERLVIVFNSAELCYFNGYQGEFKKRNLFRKLKELEVEVLEEWADCHLGEPEQFESDDEHDGDGGLEDKAADDDSDDEAAAGELEEERVLHREVKDDERLLDLLAGRSNVIISLNMRMVRRPKGESALPGLLSNLTALRFLSLRAEWLPFIEGMVQLEALEVVVSGRLSAAAIQDVAAYVAGSGPLQRLKRLVLLAEDVFINDKDKHSALLRALGQRCSSLEEVCVQGCGWKSDDLTELLEGGAPLRVLQLDKCSAVDEVHLPMIAAIKTLASLRLPCQLLGRPYADAIVQRKIVRWS